MTGKGVRRVLVLALVVAGFWTLPGEASQGAVPGYIVLGDSIEFGCTDGTTETCSPAGGYVVPFHTILAGVLPGIELHNLSEPGAETQDIQLEQLFEALSEARNHQPHGVVISLGGGGNDLRHFIASPQAATCQRVQSCLARLNALLNEAEQRLDLILGALRAQAGPSATILVRTQYNALRKGGCDPGGLAALGDAALEADTTQLRGLNPRLRELAAKYDAKVVDTFVPFFLFPDLFISADCIHPSATGYAVIVILANSAL